jgi:hypothetical protein
VTLAFGGQRFDNETLERRGAIRRQILRGCSSVEGCFSFGNRFQPTGIARAAFSLFSKCALKSFGNQVDFDSAIRNVDPSDLASANT